MPQRTGMTGDDIRLSAAKRGLLRKYLQGDFRRAPAGTAISPRPPESIIPLSSGQQQLWLHAQLAAGVPVYNQPITVHRKGPLDIPALERSLNEIIRRHEAWRTTFTVVDGRPVQVINEASPVTLPVMDLRGLPEGEREPEA